MFSAAHSTSTPLLKSLRSNTLHRFCTLTIGATAIARRSSAAVTLLSPMWAIFPCRRSSTAPRRYPRAAPRRRPRAADQRQGRQLHRLEARLAGRAQAPRVGVGRPGPARPLQPAPRRHQRRPALTALRQRLGDQLLVVADVRLVEAVHVGRVDQRHPGPQRRMDHLDRLGPAGPARDRQRHPPGGRYRTLASRSFAERTKLHTSCLRPGQGAGKNSARNEGRKRRVNHAKNRVQMQQSATPGPTRRPHNTAFSVAAAMSTTIAAPRGRPRARARRRCETPPEIGPEHRNDRGPGPRRRALLTASTIGA